MTLYRHGENGTTVDCDDRLAALLGPGWAQAGAATISQQKVPDAGESDEPPPKSGRGSSDANWTAYARANGVEVTDEMSRREVIAACEAADVATE